MKRNIIAVTADLKRCSVAISYEGEVFEINEDVDAATYLVSLTNDLIQEKKIAIENISEVMTASGPGSFTGIRVAHSFTKGLSTALKIPAKSATYFDVMLNMAKRQNDNAVNFQNSLVLIKNEKEQFYYRLNEDMSMDNDVTEKINYGVTNQGNLVHLLEGFPRRSLHLIGDENSVNSACPHASEIFDKILCRHFVQNFRRASNLIDLYENLNFSSSIQPLYINVRA